MSKLIYENETYKIRGAVFEVYNEMGSGFVESIYHECLEKEFTKQSIPYVSKQELVLYYKGEQLIHTFIPDFICYENIIVEIKAVKEIVNDHRSQVHYYLKATGYELGLLINFGCNSKACIERIVR